MPKPRADVSYTPTPNPSMPKPRADIRPNHGPPAANPSPSPNPSPNYDLQPPTLRIIYPYP